MSEPAASQSSQEPGASWASARRIGEARPFLLLLLLSIGALGLVDRSLRDQAGPLFSHPLITGLYGATWILLLLCSLAALTHHQRAMWREQRLLALLLALSLALDLVEVNVRLLQSHVPGEQLLLQAALLFVALLALFTALYRWLDLAVMQPEQPAFWWIPPPQSQLAGQRGADEAQEPWQPGFLDYLYLSCTVSFSFFPHVEPIRPSARLLVIAQLIVVFDVDLILLARAVSLIPA